MPITRSSAVGTGLSVDFDQLIAPVPAARAMVKAPATPSGAGAGAVVAVLVLTAMVAVSTAVSWVIRSDIDLVLLAALGGGPLAFLASLGALLAGRAQASRFV